MSDKEEQDGPKLDKNKSPISTRKAKKLMVLSEYLSKQESRNRTRKVSRILKKAETDLTTEERETLGENQDIVKRIHKNKERRKLSEQRTQETEDTEEELKRKCAELANALHDAKRTVIYTGAGISTAASIPDYRGPQGVWTLLQKGEELKPQDLSDAEPTVTHMCITELEKQGYVTHVVSQNCDGLHLRSGFPRKALSEVHGNMYVEMCYNCKPHREYIRLFDVTENTGVRRHQTGRHCHQCKAQLKDTIVHFGEKGRLKSPYRWREAAKAATKCDLILCLGSSLKILKKYACLWCMDRAQYKRPKLIVVNLQWTPKDNAACLKINGRCDDVMIRVMKSLGFTPPLYNRESDPIFQVASPLSDCEQSSTVKKRLIVPDSVLKSRTDSNIVPQSQCISDTESESESGSEGSTDSTGEGSSVTDSDDSDSVYDTEETGVKVENKTIRNYVKVEQVKKEVKVNQQPLDPDAEQKLMLKKKCLEKSKQICQEAVLSYQRKLSENPQLAQFGDEQLLKYAQSQTSPHLNNTNSVYISGTNHTQHTGPQYQTEYSQYMVVQNQNQPYQNNHMPNNVVSNEEHSYSKLQQQQQQQQQQQLSSEQLKFESQFFDGCSYEDRLMKLHMLKAQLQLLKEKQKGMSHPDPISLSQHQYQQQGAQIRPTSTWPAHAPIYGGVGRPGGGSVQVNLDGTMTHVHPTKSALQQEIERLESTRKQGEESQLREFQERIQKEQLELKRQHGNELLRLSQHHIIQQQLIDQNGLGALRQAENMQCFEDQQQILLSAHNQQLSNLVRQHQAQEREVREHLQVMDREILSKIQALKEADLQNQCQTMMEACADIKPRRVPGSVVNQPGVRTSVSAVNSRVAYPAAQTQAVSSTAGRQARLATAGHQARQAYPAAQTQIVNNTAIHQARLANPANSTAGHQARLAYPAVQTQVVNNTAASHQVSLKSPPLVKSPHSDYSIAAIMNVTPPNHASVQPTHPQIRVTRPTAPHTKTSVPHTKPSVPPTAYAHPLPSQTVSQTTPTQPPVPGPPAVSAIPGFQELVSTLNTCDHCKSLPAYQRVNQHCPRCEELRQKHSTSHRQTLANYSGPARPVSQQAPQHVPNPQHQSQQYAASQTVSTNGCNTDYTKVKVRTTSAGQLSTHFDQNYLPSQAGYTTSVSIPQQSNTVYTHPHSSTAETVRQQRGSTTMVLQDRAYLSTSDIKVSATSELELSPVIPYANCSSTRKERGKSPVITLTQISQPSQGLPCVTTSAYNSANVGQTVPNVQTSSDTASTNIPQQSNALITNSAVSRSGHSLSVAASGSKTVPDHLFRSHSQSELYDTQLDESAAALRTVRSKSQSELVSGSDTGEGNQTVGLGDKESSPAAEDGASKNGKKRKTAVKTATVPGWFGKGLNLKKKRKY